tara:strand:+ start:251 stop:553 length:303 start_codon:yes stop_codon:yes gene_type:complete
VGFVALSIPDFLLLYLNFRNIVESIVVMVSTGFRLIGGIRFIYANDYNIFVTLPVGFIALAGMVAEIGVLVLSFIAQEFSSRDATKPFSVDMVKTTMRLT